MLQVASSFGAEPSMDTVIYSIPVRISEAVLTMQENMEIYTSKVRTLKLSIYFKLAWVGWIQMWGVGLNIYRSHKDHLYNYTQLSLCCVSGFQGLWGPWWGRNTKFNIWGAEKESKYSYCPGIQTHPKICSQTGGAGVCMCGSVHFGTTFMSFIQCYWSVCAIPRSQTCPVNWRKCSFTGSNSPRLCAVVKRHSSTNGDKCWNGITKARYCIFRANLF